MCDDKKFIRSVLLLLFIAINYAIAQGPKLSYLYNLKTDLSWASCYIYLDGGSRQKIPFLPMINYKGAACGTKKYTKEIDVNCPIVFVGNGIHKEKEFDCYRNMDVKDKIVMFCYDFPDTTHAQLEQDFSKEKRIDDAVSRGVAAVILFSYIEEFPSRKYMDTTIEKIPEIPIICIKLGAAKNILASAGRDSEKIFRKWQAAGEFTSEVLICKMKLYIKGQFDRLETDNFLFTFRSELISEEQMRQLVAVNEESVKFIENLLESEQLKWSKSFVAYFRDYDSKLFYTAHWGRGWSFEGGTFMIFDGSIPDFGLAVHENTHTLIHNYWSGSSSFMNEGIAKYAEAMATDKDANHLRVIEFLKTNKMISLGDMLDINIGSHESTGIAYPASGSFISYLVETYGLEKLKIAYRRESQKKKTNKDTWQPTYGKSLASLEKEWLFWLSGKYDIDEDIIYEFINRK